MANIRNFHNGKLVPCDEEVPVAATPVKSKCREAEDTPEKVVPVAKGGLPEVIASQRFVAISLPSCPQCDELGAALAERGVPKSVFVKWEKGSPEYPALKAALAAHAGDGFTFPQVFADGVYQGGFFDAMDKLEEGVYDELFQEVFAVTPTTVQRLVKKQSMLVLSLPNCPQCDELRTQLQERGLPVGEIFVKWDKAKPQYQCLKAQLIQLIGKSQFTFPQTFIRSEYQGDFHDVTDKVAAGEFDAFFSDTFGVAAPKPAATLEAVSIGFDEDF